MSGDGPWLSAPLGGPQETNDDDAVSDPEFHALLGGVPVERLGRNSTPEPRIEDLPPPPYAASDEGSSGIADPWASSTTGAGSSGWGASAEPERVSNPSELLERTTGDSGLRNDVWADLTDPDPGPFPFPVPVSADAVEDGAGGNLDDLFDGVTPAVDEPQEEVADAEPAPLPVVPPPAPQNVSVWDDVTSSMPVAHAADQPADQPIDEPSTPRVDTPAAAEAAPAIDDVTPPTEPAPAPSEPDGADDAGQPTGGLEDLFGDDDMFEAAATPAPAPVVNAPRAARWELGTDRYEDPQIVHAAELITSHASTIPSVTEVTRKFKLTRDLDLDRDQRIELEQALEPHLHQIMNLQIGAADYAAVLDLVYDELLGLGPLGAAWRAAEVTEILVDGWDKIIVEVDGELLGTDMRFRDAEQANSIARALAQTVSDRQLSPNTPLVTAKLDKARVNFAYGPVVPELGLAISIRKFNPQMTMDGLIGAGALDPAMRDLLWAVVRARGTVLVSGATGVGKTTLLTAAAEAIPYNERIITIEDAREINLGDRLSWVPMQTKEKASGDDTGLIEQADLLVNSLRQRPDRLIVGEIRDGRTASVMLEAANTGHEGTMTTLHANSATDALNSRIVRAIRRVEDSPAEVIREEVAEAFDLVMHGLRRRGRRFVAEICEVSPAHIVGGRIEPRVLWQAHIDTDRNVTFEHVAGLDPNGRIAQRLAELGEDPTAFDPA